MASIRIVRGKGEHIRAFGLVAALACVGSALLASPAAAQVPDASCPEPGNTTFSTGGYRIAQTFTAQHTGSLVSGQMEANKGGSTGGDWVMQLYATNGTGTPVYTVLASTIPIPDSTVPAGVSKLTGVFASPAAVTAGNVYALILMRPGALLAAQAWDDNHCPGSQFQTFSTSDSFVPNFPGYDFVFSVFVKPTNAFSLGGVTSDKKKGSAIVTADLPYPGELTGSGNGASVARAPEAGTSKSVGAGHAQLVIKAKGKKKRTLSKTGKVKLNIAVTYTPTGGDPSTQSVKVKLKKRL
jgi:hypothetical protein